MDTNIEAFRTSYRRKKSDFGKKLLSMVRSCVLEELEYIV